MHDESFCRKTSGCKARTVAVIHDLPSPVHLAPVSQSCHEVPPALNPGEGAGFASSLPLPVPPSLPTTETAARPRLNENFALEHPLRILVVDDDQVNRKLAQAFLKQLGYQAATAASGHEAVEQFQRDAPDFVLMDEQMPGMGGQEATRRIRRMETARSGNQRSFVCALTASTVPGSRQQCLASGMDEYLTKPFCPVMLAVVLAWASKMRTDTPRNVPQVFAPPEPISAIKPPPGPGPHIFRTG